MATADIPLARRTHAVSGNGQAKVWRKLLAFGTLVLLFAAVLFIFVKPIRHLLPLPPNDKLLAMRTADGRLLGHFPYPEARESQLVFVSPGMKLHQEAAQAYLAMEQAAAADGVSLSLLSAFRSVDDQKHLFFGVKAQRNQSSFERAKVSAPPGFSEHSTGFAIDIGDSQQPNSNLSQTFTQTRAYRWLQNNAARYQFTLSFPKNNPQGVSFEPWHWRYEGSVDALRLFEPAQRLGRGTPGN
jgi:D-alanyl-D-alanine carboxypeptidase